MCVQVSDFTKKICVHRCVRLLVHVQVSSWCLSRAVFCVQSCQGGGWNVPEGKGKGNVKGKGQDETGWGAAAWGPAVSKGPAWDKVRDSYYNSHVTRRLPLGTVFSHC
jgi:hypothetical protein